MTTSWTTGLLAVGLGAMLGRTLQTQHGFWADTGIGAGIGLVALILTLLSLSLVRVLLRALPATVGHVGLAGFVSMMFLLDLTGFTLGFAALLAAGLTLLCGCLFGGLISMWSGSLGRGTYSQIATITALLIGIGGLGATAWFFDSTGTPATVYAATSDPMPPIPVESPARGGSHTVVVETYGSGSDPHRPEFAAEADWTSATVDGSDFVEMPKGFRGGLRRDFWGFDEESLPLNGRVWRPDSGGPFPLVLCVHGNHRMSDWSDTGYGWLGSLLASRGYVFVSVDQNFLNSGGVAFGGMRKENDARGWLLLKHLEAWRAWNGEAGHAAEGLVDLDKVTLIGHSRGGEAVCHAALFNRLRFYPDDATVELPSGFGIEAIISIAPVSSQYRPADRMVALQNVSYLTLHGGHDADVSSFDGDRLWENVTFSSAASRHFKASVWLHRANHGQFNTSWGANDVSLPRSLLLNQAALMSGTDQRQIGSVYIAGFIDCVIQRRDEFRSLFRDWRHGAEWLPEAGPLVTRYRDATYRTICDFSEDVDVTTGTLAGSAVDTHGLSDWREADRPMRGSASRRRYAAFIGWENDSDAWPAGDAEPAEASSTADASEPTEAVHQAGPAPHYAVRIPDAHDLPLAGDAALVLALAVADESPGDTDLDEDRTAPIDLTLELVDDSGDVARLPLSRFGTLWPPLRSTMTRSSFTERFGSDCEPVLQTFEIPLRLFQDAEPRFDAARLSEVRLVFDRTRAAVLILDSIGVCTYR